MYTQLNQYHVILEAAPNTQLGPGKLQDLYIQTNASAGVPDRERRRPTHPPDLHPLAPMQHNLCKIHAVVDGAQRAANAIKSSVGASSTASTRMRRLASRCPRCATERFTHFEKAFEPLSINHQASSRPSPCRSILPHARWRRNHGY